MSKEDSEDIFFPAGIPDGYTATMTIPELKGIYSEAVISYRPALYSEREDWKTKVVGLSGDRKAKIDFALMKTHLKAINGRQVPPSDFARLKPKLIDRILDAILGYDPEDEEADAKNS
jgi:hypothetical protein